MDSFAGFDILDTLSEGSRPAVYKAQDGDGLQVHLKVYPPEGRSGDDTLRIKRDIEALGKFECARVVPVVATGEEDGSLWYAVKMPPGSTLAEEFETRFAEGGPGFSVEDVLQLAIGLGEALGYLHERDVVHGDLSADNILMVPVMGPVLREHFPGAATGKAAAEEVSSIRYASPEQVQLETVSRTSDVYQAGLVLYYALTGKMPLEDENPFQTVLRRMQEEMPPPSKFRDGVPDELDVVLLRCLKADPTLRYKDMNEFLEDVLRLDPSSGQLLPGQAMDVEREPEYDPLAGLILPGEDRPEPATAGDILSAVVPGILVGVVIVFVFMILLR
jgi:serine/threonine-protein kinase